MKIIIRTVFVFSFSLLISAFYKVEIDDFFLNTIFTVSSIMFSIGLGLIVTFSYHGVRNMDYIKALRINILTVRNSYIYWFTLSTLLYLIEKYFRNYFIKIELILIPEVFFSINLSVIISLIILFSIFYYILNFLKIQKLNDDIFDKLNKN